MSDIHHLNSSEIQGLDKIRKLNLINSITGVKPGNLIGTVSESGVENLAVFSSIIHLGSSPALLGFILRPDGEVRRDTFENIRKTGFYTINHIPSSMVENAHYTAAKFPAEESEFKQCGFTAIYELGFAAPFVKESRLRIGMRYLQSIPIERNGTRLVIGEVEHVCLNPDSWDEEGHLNLEQLGSAGISGLNTYYSLKKIDTFPYARVAEKPDFN